MMYIDMTRQRATKDDISCHIIISQGKAKYDGAVCINKDKSLS